jgi:glycosyltransferase involved in cell wall biosynthesis
MKKVLLLTSPEVPFRGNLIEGQFLAPILGDGKNRDNLKYRYLSLAPIMFYTGRRQPLKTYGAGRAKRSVLKAFTAGLGCRTDYWPILFPLFPRDFNLTRAKYHIFLASALGPFFIYLVIYRPELVIARSYPAASLARLARQYLNIPFIFDLRGMYPEESVNAGIFGAGSPDYKFWKRRERILVSQSAMNMVVSEPFAEHLRNIDPKSAVSVIPCCVDVQKVKFEPGRREILKEQQGVKGRFVLLHLGSFGTKDDRKLAARYLKRFRKVRPDAVLAIVSGTPAFGPDIKKELQSQNLTEDDYRIIHPGPEDVPGLLALGDAGLILESMRPNTRVCLSVKLGEYLAAGLPVICTPFVEGAARLVRQYDCGLVVDPDGDEPLEKEIGFIKSYSRLQKNGFQLVKEVLSLEHCQELWRQAIKQAIQ